MKPLLFITTILLLPFSESAFCAEIKIDCAKEIGTIRALNSINGGPVENQGLIDLSAYHRQLKVPLTRLHDCNWPVADCIDIHTIFPNFIADPSLPENYDFTRTDAYIKSVLATGSGIVYRLGENIEHGSDKRRSQPPADAAKWAQICLGIISHYNDGWANGRHDNIRYWEIWNEPENRPNCWSGSDEEYFKLYAVASKAIKRRFPDIRIGGPAVGNTGRVEKGVFTPSEFTTKFIDYCKRESLPLDFFSWHIYTDDPRDVLIEAKGVRDLLDRAGFNKVESHLNEWNYLPEKDWGPVVKEGQGEKREKFYARAGGPEGAAFVACVLGGLQDVPIDAANFFSGNSQSFGLFNVHGVPKKTFYAFKAFSSLLETPVRLQVSGGLAGRLGVCAGTNSDHSEVRVMLSNFSKQAEKLNLTVEQFPWEGASKYEILVVDAGENGDKPRIGHLEPGHHLIELPMSAYSVVVLKIHRADSK